MTIAEITRKMIDFYHGNVHGIDHFLKVYALGHHHTLTGVDGPDYQILLEADYLVNADEGGYTREHIEQTLNTMFKTPTGIALLKSIYLENEN